MTASGSASLTTTASVRPVPTTGTLKVAYMMSRFPKITETFILFEIVAMRRAGVSVAVYPLLRARNSALHTEAASPWRKILERFVPTTDRPVMHPEAEEIARDAHFAPFLSPSILSANLRAFACAPRKYVSTLFALIRGNLGSLNLWAGALTVFPRCVYFARLMQAEKITHIHAHFATHPAAAAFIIHRLTGIPYSFTAHGADIQVHQQMLREKVAESEFVAAISEYNREFLVAHCGEPVRQKIRVIHCGVDTAVFERQRRSQRHGRFSIICIGTLYSVKGQSYLIEACRRLRSGGVELTCHLVGDGPDRSVLERQAVESGLQDEIRFHGACTRSEVAELLATADVAVAPSVPTPCGRREGIPVVLMEAMASGLPVVASRISGIPELVDHEVSGLLVEPRAPDEIALALRRLQADPGLRERLGAAGRLKVEREFSLDTNAAELARYFVRELGQ